MSAVDVLAVIARLPCRCLSVAQLGERSTACDRCQARAAVAELMEADEEYDAARASLNNPAPVVRGWFADLKYQDAVRRFNTASDRRAAALSRCKGEK